MPGHCDTPSSRRPLLPTPGPTGSPSPARPDPPCSLVFLYSDLRLNEAPLYESLGLAPRLFRCKCPHSFIPKYNLIIFVFPQHLTQMLAQSWWPMNMSCWPCCGEGDWPPWGEQQLRVQARGQNARVSSRDQLRDPDQNQPL